MATAYTEIPDNFNEIENYVTTQTEAIKLCFFTPVKIIFYDACSFQRHSNLSPWVKSLLISYIKSQGEVVFITRCVLMELASISRSLQPRYIDFIKALDKAGVRVVVFNEEHAYNILQECFSTNEMINSYLTWAVRAVHSPVSTITETLNNDIKLYAALNNSDGYTKSHLYDWFFSAVRGNKERNDNLGEELIIICVHILSNLPRHDGDGKLIFLTDDKRAASAFGRAMRKTNPKYKGARIALFSTPKLVQHMFREKFYLSKTEMIEILSQGVDGNVGVSGLLAYDLEINPNISMPAEDLAQRIMSPNGIEIVF